MAAQFPRVVFVALIVMSLILFAFGVYKTLKPEMWKKSDSLLGIKIVRQPLVLFTLVSAYLVLMHFTNFFISTLIFIPVCMLYFGARSIRQILITNVALNLFIYLFFVRLLNVWMP